MLIEVDLKEILENGSLLNETSIFVLYLLELPDGESNIEGKENKLLVNDLFFPLLNC